MELWLPVYEHVIIVVFRKTAATKLNPHSSRSHSIVLMKVFCQEIYVIMLLIEVLDIRLQIYQPRGCGH